MKLFFFDILITLNDHSRYLEHVSFRMYVLFTLVGYWACARGGGGGAPKGLVHNLLMQFFTLGSSKIELPETYFFDTAIT